MERNEIYDNMSKARKLLFDFQQDMAFKMTAECMERALEYVKDMCELQKEECANYISIESTEFGTKKIKHLQVLKTKNVCDEI